jgi:hypothetical protein
MDYGASAKGLLTPSSIISIGKTLIGVLREFAGLKEKT